MSAAFPIRTTSARTNGSNSRKTCYLSLDGGMVSSSTLATQQQQQQQQQQSFALSTTNKKAMSGTSTQSGGSSTSSSKKSKSKLFFRRSSSHASRRHLKQDGTISTNSNVSDTNSTATSSTWDDSFASFPNINHSQRSLFAATTPTGVETIINSSNNSREINSLWCNNTSNHHQYHNGSSRPPGLPPLGGSNHELRGSASQQYYLRQQQQHARQRLADERSLGPIDVDSVGTQEFAQHQPQTRTRAPPSAAPAPAPVVIPQRPVVNIRVLEEGEQDDFYFVQSPSSPHRRLRTIPSGEELPTCSNASATSGESASTAAANNGKAPSSIFTAPSVATRTSSLQRRTRILAESSLDGGGGGAHQGGCPMDQPIEVSVLQRSRSAPTTTTTTASEQAERRAGPVDIDDFIPPDSYWAQEQHEIILDEVEICRGLAGYMAGFEPEIISDLSQLGDWNEDVAGEADEDEYDYFSKYRTGWAAATSSNHTRSRSRSHNNNINNNNMRHHPQHRRVYSLPETAAEC